MPRPAPTKKQRQVMREYIANPLLTTQTEVMKRLQLKDRNDFYRVFTRCIVADRMDEIDADE